MGETLLKELLIGSLDQHFQIDGRSISKRLDSDACLKTINDQTFLKIPANLLNNVIRNSNGCSSPQRIQILNCIIIGNLNLEAWQSDAWLEFKDCIFLGSLNLKNAKLASLYIRQTDFLPVELDTFLDNQFGRKFGLNVCDALGNDVVDAFKTEMGVRSRQLSGIRASGIRLTGGLRLGHNTKIDFIDLRAATIGGDAIFDRVVINSLACTPDELLNDSHFASTNRYWARHGCAMYSRGAKFGSNLTIDACNIGGEIYLADAEVEESLYISRTLIIQPDEYNEPNLSNRKSYAIHADRLRVGGRFSIGERMKKLPPDAEEVVIPRIPNCLIFGKLRLVGLITKGALVFASAVVHSRSKEAISIIGANIGGLLSFTNSRLSTANAKAHSVKATRIHVGGDFFLQMSKRSPGTTSSAIAGTHFKIKEALNTIQTSLAPDKDRNTVRINLQDQIKHTSINNEARVGGSTLSNEEHLTTAFNYFPSEFRDYVIRHHVESLGSLFNVEGVEFNQQKFLNIPMFFLKLFLWGNSEDDTQPTKALSLKDYDQKVADLNDEEQPGNLLDWNKLRTGQVEICFFSNGLDIAGATIVGALRSSGCILGTPNFFQGSSPIMEAERIQVGRGVFLTIGFVSFGAVNFRRATLGADFSCIGALMAPSRLDHSEDHSDAVRPLRTTRTLGLSGARISGNLDLSGGRFIEPRRLEANEASKDAKRLGFVGDTEKRSSFAVYANRAKIEGAVFCRNGFAIDGAASFVSAEVSKSFFFEPIITVDGMLPLVSAKGVERIFNDTIGTDWLVDLDAAEIDHGIVLRCLAAGWIFNVNSAANLNNEEAAAGESIFAAIEKLIDELYGYDDPSFIEDGESRFIKVGRSRLSDSKKNFESRVRDVSRTLRDFVIQNENKANDSTRKLYQQFEDHRFKWPENKGGLASALPKQDNKLTGLRGVKGLIDLTNTKTDTYTDDYTFYSGKRDMVRRGAEKGVSTWSRDITLRLEGFEYKQFGVGCLDTGRNELSRIKWLKQQYLTEGCFGRLDAIIAPCTLILLITLISAMSTALHTDATRETLLVLIIGAVFTFSVAMIPLAIDLLKLCFSQPSDHRNELMAKFWNNSASKIVLFFAASLLLFFIVSSGIISLLTQYSSLTICIFILLTLLPAVVAIAKCTYWFYRKSDLQRLISNQKTPLRQEINDGKQAWHAFRSQPWIQCANTLKAAGLEHHSRRLLLSRERLHAMSNQIPLPDMVLRATILVLYGRGIVRWYPVIWFLGFYAFAAATFTIAFDLNMMRPSEAVMLNDLEHGALPNEKSHRLAPGYSTPHSLVYAFEIMTPGFPMRQENRWSPCAQKHINRFALTNRVSGLEGTEGFNLDSRVCRPLNAGLERRQRPPIYFDPILTSRLQGKTLKEIGLSQRFEFEDWMEVTGALPCDPILQPDYKGLVSWMQAVSEYKNQSEISTNRKLLKLIERWLEVSASGADPTTMFSEKEVSLLYSEFGKQRFHPVTVSACFWGAAWNSSEKLFGISLLENFLLRDMLRHASWIFIGYGWLLIGGLVISLSSLLLREQM